MDLNTLTPEELLLLTPTQLKIHVLDCGQQMNLVREKISRLPGLDETLSAELRGLATLRKTLLARQQELQPTAPASLTRNPARHAA